MYTVKNMISGHRNEAVNNYGQPTRMSTGRLSGEGSHLAKASQSMPGSYPIESGFEIPQTTFETSDVTGGQSSTVDSPQLTKKADASVNSKNTAYCPGLLDNNMASNTGNTITSSHMTKDAGIGAGATGLAEHEHSKNHHGVLSRPHQSNMMMKVERQSHTNESGTQPTNDQHSGFITNTSNSATTSHNTPNSNQLNTVSTSNTEAQNNSQIAQNVPITSATDTTKNEPEKHGHKKTDSGIAGVVPFDQPNHTPEHATDSHKDIHDSKTNAAADTEHTQSHHWGRDAALASGFSVGEYEDNTHNNGVTVEKTEKKADKKADKKAEKKEKKHHKHSEHKHGEHQHDEHRHGKLANILSFLHRDKNKKYTKEEEAEFERQEREHKAAQLGHDAAHGGEVAAATGGTTVAEKHRSRDSSDVSTATLSDRHSNEYTKKHGEWHGPAPTTTGPHSADWLNRLDPAVDSKAFGSPSSTACVGAKPAVMSGAHMPPAVATVDRDSEACDW